MPQRALVAASLAVLGLSPALAQSWSFGFGVEYGVPLYYGPPPVYVYEQPPAVLLPPPPILSSVPPDVVFDNLERAGYHNFGPMAFRDGVYKLSAVNGRGDLVSLEVSAITGAVEREYVLAGRGAAELPHPVPPPAVAPPPGAPSEDPLVVY